jgi:hypothetical protein
VPPEIFTFKKKSAEYTNEPNPERTIKGNKKRLSRLENLYWLAVSTQKMRKRP